MLAISKACNVVPNPSESLSSQDANEITSDDFEYQRLQNQVSSDMRSLHSQGTFIQDSHRFESERTTAVQFPNI